MLMVTREQVRGWWRDFVHLAGALAEPRWELVDDVREVMRKVGLAEQSSPAVGEALGEEIERFRAVCEEAERALLKAWEAAEGLAKKVKKKEREMRLWMEELQK